MSSKGQPKNATLIAILGLIYLAPSQTTLASTNDSWFAVGFNERRIAVTWVQLNSFTFLNESSFRLNAKSANERGAQVVGRLDINCKNKDWYFRPNGVMFQGAPWATIPSGSGLEAVAKYFCKRTSAREEWGYSSSTKILWDQPSPEEQPGNAIGEWVLASDTDEAEVYFNDSVKAKDGFIQAASWSRSKKGERSAAQPSDTQNYYWMNVSCSSNLYSLFWKPDISVKGEWMPPNPGRPGGAATMIRKRYCS